MKLKHAVLAAAAVVVTAVAGGAGVAALTHDNRPDAAGPSPSTSATPSTSTPLSPSPSTATPTATPTATSSRAGSASPSASTASRPTGSPSTSDPLSAENLLRERAYHDATGHDFTLAKRASDLLGPCTGDTTFAEALPRKLVTTRSIQLDGPDGERVVEHMAQTASASEARTAATEIIAEVKECYGIQGGDFGYGDPVTVSSDDDGELVYFPAYDTDRPYGGYIVTQTGARVGVVDVGDAISASKLVGLAKLAAEIAAV